MNSDLKRIIDDYIEEFLNQDIVKKYFALEEYINSSNYLNELQTKMKNAQKDLALSLNDGTYNQKKEYFLKLQDEFYNDPHVVNYHLLQEEILNILKNFSEKIKK